MDFDAAWFKENRFGIRRNPLEHTLNPSSLRRIATPNQAGLVKLNPPVVRSVERGVNQLRLPSAGTYGPACGGSFGGCQSDSQYFVSTA